MIVERPYKVCQPQSFHDFAVVYFGLPDQQIGDSARILEKALHHLCGYDRYVLAVQSCLETEKMAAPAVLVLSPLHSARTRFPRSIRNDLDSFDRRGRVGVKFGDVFQ